MIHYILQTIAFQLLFLVVYDLFLKKETFFTWNRIYLLATPILSFLLPLFKIEAFRKAIPEQYLVQLPEVVVGGESAQKAIALNSVNISGTTTSFLTISEILQALWLFGMVVALLLFGLKLFKFYKLKKSGVSKKAGKLNIIQLPKGNSAFSFFNTVFLGSGLSEKHQKTILLHEQVHAAQKHTADLLFFEALRILCWFNPLVYVFQKRMTELQEFVADSCVIQQQNRKTYYEGLLSQVFQTHDISFTNTFFNQSLFKKRIVMLQKAKSKKIFQLKYLLLVPVVCGMLFYTSCTQETGVGDENASLTQKIADLQADIESKEMSKEERQAFINMVQKTLSLKDENNKIIIDKNGVVTSIAREETNTGNGDVPFAAIDKVPTYPGCEGMSNKEAKDCMAKKIQQFVASNFNTKVADKANLTGKQRIFVQFKIDKQGNVADARARGPHPDLETEALRVVNTMPKMQPGEQDGEKVGVLYSLPILFMVEE
ncbi:M56 family metallopeptidase [Marixanthomonas spongiae]|uniref:BlaR1 peptidase M56 family protein n=1 Tax=Marixanthomonas spongiae TaxID=2174845 RepID=A0A2U0HZE3_9FLAO|nr:M56 family metallopeptidase [Marixanthomonas spongiae]PVW14208.1 blaR1 peptidase M56 family protein [Marixanthomonas spongiae]